MTTALGFKGALLAIGEEITWGDQVARTKVFCALSDALAVTEEEIKTACINKRYYKAEDIRRGKITAGGTVETELYYEGYGLLFKNLLGEATQTEVASFVVDGSNQFLDFAEDGGGGLTATIPQSTYELGTSESDVGTLCQIIAQELENIGLGTYTVAYSPVTNIFSISVSGSATTVQLEFQSGTHGSGGGSDDNIGSLIGFDDTVDTADSSSVASTEAIEVVYQTIFQNVDTQQVGLTCEFLEDETLVNGKAKLYTGVRISEMSFSSATNARVTTSLTLIAKDETLEDIETATSIEPIEDVPVLYYDATLKINGVSQIGIVKAFNLTMNQSLDDDNQNLGTRTISEEWPNAKAEFTGTFTIEYENRDLYDQFRDNDTVQLDFECITTLAMDELPGGLARKILFSMPTCKLTGQSPQISDEGKITLEIPFSCYAQDTDNREATITTINTEYLA